jgi:hypothetical protein
MSDPTGVGQMIPRSTVSNSHLFAYSLHMTAPDDRHSAVAGEAALGLRARARSRWKVAGVLGGITVTGTLVLIFAPLISFSSEACPPGVSCPVAEQGQVWVAITAVGTFVAGIGTLMSAIAAVLALRAAAAARTAAAAPTKRSPVKRTRKRKSV